VLKPFGAKELVDLLMAGVCFECILEYVKRILARRHR
jgi:hypothetical protein